MKLTSVDTKIIQILSEDSRMPATGIAERLGLPESTVRGRIHRLVENEVIQFVAQTNPVQMGFSTWVAIGIKCNLSAVPKILQQLDAFDEVYFVAETTGGFDIMVNAIFKDSQTLHLFLSQKLAKVEGVKETTTIHFINVSKRKIAWAPLEQPGDHS